MALQRLLDNTDNPLEPSELYTRVEFPNPPPDRPYVFVNMVATADGRIILGDLGESAKGVGEATDQLLFRRLQYAGDAALLGSATLRATPAVLYPVEKPRFVVTGSGDVPLQNRFFTDSPDRAYILAPQDLPAEKRDALRANAHLIERGFGKVDLVEALRYLRQEMGIRALLCEGGGVLNEELLKAGCMDELFLTVTPKLKGGTRLPGILEGEGLPRGEYRPLEIISLYCDGDELYFRYRVASANKKAKAFQK